MGFTGQILQQEGHQTLFLCFHPGGDQGAFESRMGDLHHLCLICFLEPGEASSSEEEPPSPEDKENQAPKRAGPHLRFEISSEDGFIVEAESLEGELVEGGCVAREGRSPIEPHPDCSGPALSPGAWRTLIEKVQEARGHARLRHLSFSGN